METKKVVQANEFQVVDESGEVCGTFGLSAGNPGIAQLQLIGGTRKLGEDWVLNPGILITPSSIKIHDASGRARIQIAMLPSEVGPFPSIIVTSSTGQPFVSMSVSPYEDGELVVVDSQGKTVWMSSTEEE